MGRKMLESLEYLPAKGVSHSRDNMARWFSWLERRPLTAEITSSSLVRVTQLEFSKLTMLALECIVRMAEPYRINSKGWGLGQ